MQKKLRTEIEKMNKEQLIDILEQMCNMKETENLLKLIVAPSMNDIKKLLAKFDAWTASYIQNSCNDRAREQMYQSAEMLYAVLKHADDRTSAYVIYRMHEILYNNDLRDYADGDDYYELVDDLLPDLAHILKRSPGLFSSDELEKYSAIVKLEE